MESTREPINYRLDHDIWLPDVETWNLGGGDLPNPSQWLISWSNETEHEVYPGENEDKRREQTGGE